MQEAIDEQEAFNVRLRDARDARHAVMLKELHARCEAKKNALREERFWNEVMEEAQGCDFPY